MRQAVMPKPGIVEIRDVPEPVPGPGEVLLRVRRIGICGSDIHVYHGVQPFTSYPVVQGHEFSAVVEAAGQGLGGIARGTKVTALPQVLCGRCKPCLRGDYHICDNLRVQGFQAPGCAQDLFVTRAEKIVPLPDTFTFEQGAFVEPAAVAVHAVLRAGKVQGRNAVVLGGGTIGNLVAQVARASGAEVLITDIEEFRLDVARRCGLEKVSNARRESLADAVGRTFGGDGFDLAFECVGVQDTISEAVANIGKGGAILVVGVFPSRPCVDLATLNVSELSLVGTQMYKYEDYIGAVDLIASGRIVTEPLDSRHFPFGEYAAAYRFIEEAAGNRMKVFIDL